MGEPRKRMGNTTGHGKRRQHMGRPPGRMGEPKITLKPEILERWAACGLADFNEFLMGNAVLSGRPLKCMGIIKNMAMHEPPDVACGLRIFGNIGGGRLGMGDGPVRRGHTGECCGGAPAGNRDAWSSCHSAPQRRVAPCLCVQKGATTRSCRNAPMHGIASARRARPWILYGPSEQSRWAPQLGQRSWQACMSIIICPHMGHSFFLPAAIHRAPGSAPYYSCRHARCLRQRLPCLCAHMRQSCRMRESPVKCGQPVPGPHRASRTWPQCVPEPSGPSPRPIWLHGSGRSPGASGIPATDALSPQLALKAPLCLPVQPVCMVAVP